MTQERRPWENGRPILEVLRDAGPGAGELPDEAEGGNQVRFAAGAWDGILSHHVAGVDEQAEAHLVAGLLEAVTRLVREDDDDSREALYQLLLGESLVRHMDVILREMTQQEELGPLDVLPYARWLVRHAAHRNPLKMGMALVGLCGNEEDLDDLRVLARHDEFTLFAAVAVANLVEDPVAEWWEMARHVQGWGKVHLVERLCQHGSDRDELRDWLLRHGCANEVMPEYLALACATGGRLAEALAEDEPDDELLDGACTILTALLSPDGPAGDVDSYPEGADAVRALLGHLEGRCTTLERLRVVAHVGRWLQTGDEEAWAEREEQGWTEDLREDLLARCNEVLARPEWRQRVLKAFASGDEAKRYLAWSLSEPVGIDLWDDAFARLESDPLEPWLYSILLQTDDAERAARVIAFAEAHLPLAEVATGPADLLGFGPEFRPHNCLDSLVQRMQQGEGLSGPLVAAALRSPVVRNRHLAASALEAHPVEAWGPDVRRALGQTRQDETDEQLREKWRELAERLGK
jgi:hypothetical protein